MTSALNTPHRAATGREMSQVRWKATCTCARVDETNG